MQVTLKTNGQITISGHIDLWDVGHSYPTVLKGDVNSGEISGIWEEGDLIKVEIIRSNKIEELQSATLSSVSIFELDNKTFKLKIDKVNFIETKPFKLERDKKYLQPFQLHKADIFGNLRARSDNTKKINFGTLVFKQDGTLQRLTINVGDRTVNLFKQHSDSLQKKCGSELINEWDG